MQVALRLTHQRHLAMTLFDERRHLHFHTPSIPQWVFFFIDSLELVVLLDRNYGIKLKDPKEGRHVFQSIRTMAEYIAKNRQLSV